MEKYIDMHIHSIKSDGEKSITELFEMAKERNIATLSITDHDALPDGINEDIAKDYDIKYVRGTEISSIMDDKIKMHILAYNFQEDKLKNLIDNIQSLRKERLLTILRVLEKKKNIVFEDEKIEDILNRDGSISTLHLMQLLLEEGYGDNFDYIYDNYIKPYRTKINIRKNSSEVLQTIRHDNGISVLAHPKKIETSYHIDIKEIIPLLIDQGLDGIEVSHSIHTREDIERYRLLALKYNLLMSAGSDYHGPHIRLNRVLGEVSKEKDKVKEITLLDKINRL